MVVKPAVKIFSVNRIYAMMQCVNYQLKATAMIIAIAHQDAVAARINASKAAIVATVLIWGMHALVIMSA